MSNADALTKEYPTKLRVVHSNRKASSTRIQQVVVEATEKRKKLESSAVGEEMA